MQRLLSFQIGVACLLLLAGCTSHEEKRAVSKSKEPPAQTAGVQPTSAEGTDLKSNDDSYKVRFETTKGDFVVKVEPSWAPVGAARFRELVEIGFFDECRFFRVMPDFMVQFGINGDPKIQKKWKEANLPDDFPRQSNTRGRITFATAGPNTRTTQVFINYNNNYRLNSDGFAPFGEVIDGGMDVVDAINSEYKQEPDQGLIQSVGNGYLNRNFPNLDYIKSAKVIE